MTVQGNLAYTGAVQLGQTHQHDTATIVDIWGVLSADIVEDGTSVTITMNGALWYNGYDNYVPWELGVRKVYEDETSSTQSAQGRWDRTTSMWTSDGQWDWWWMTESSFTFEKEDVKFGLIPFMRIGCLNRYGSMGDSGSGSYWIYGNEYGLLCMNSVTENCLKGGMTYNGVDLDAFILFAGANSTSDYSYSNSVKIVSPSSPLYVANSSGVYTKASAVYVYGSDGTPKRATSVTVYNSSGAPVTMSC